MNITEDQPDAGLIDVMGKKHGASIHSECTTLLKSPQGHQPRKFSKQPFGFLWRLYYLGILIKWYAIVDWTQSQSFFAQMGEGTDSSNRVASTGNQLPSLGYGGTFQSHFISKKKKKKKKKTFVALTT